MRNRRTLLTRVVRNFISRNIIVTNLNIEKGKQTQLNNMSTGSSTDTFGLHDVNGSVRTRKANIHIKQEELNRQDVLES